MDDKQTIHKPDHQPYNPAEPRKVIVDPNRFGFLIMDIKDFFKKLRDKIKML